MMKNEAPYITIIRILTVKCYNIIIIIVHLVIVGFMETA